MFCKIHPTGSSNVTVHYQASLVDGTIFDSSLGKNPVSFKLNATIPSREEGIPLMAVGDKYRFYIPSDIGYSHRDIGDISVGSLLILRLNYYQLIHNKLVGNFLIQILVVMKFYIWDS